MERQIPVLSNISLYYTNLRLKCLKLRQFQSCRMVWHARKYISSVKIPKWLISHPEHVRNTRKKDFLLAQEQGIAAHNLETKAEAKLFCQRTSENLHLFMLLAQQVFRQQSSSNGHPYHINKPTLPWTLDPCHQCQWCAHPCDSDRIQKACCIKGEEDCSLQAPIDLKYVT